MKFNYFDIHSHLNLEPLFSKKDEIIQTLRQENIGTITVGVDYETSKIAVDLANINKDILWATVGQHPNDNKDEIFEYEKYLELAKDDKVVAIGECGLDYYRLKPAHNATSTAVAGGGSEEEKDLEIERQISLFKQHIKLSVELGKPLMIHARPHVNSEDAYNDVIRILEEENFTGIANFHFFVGNLATAKKIISKGWTVSYDGPITFTEDYRDTINQIPTENIMAETDAPFAAPAPHRGQTNYPQYVEFVYKKIAEIKGETLEDTKTKLFSNITRVFKINFDK